MNDMKMTSLKDEVLTSRFKHYGFGIVTKDKIENEDSITVFPIEYMGEFDGKLDKTKLIKFIRTNELKDPILKSVVIDHTIPATWLPLHQSNRYGSPDVTNGETVALFRYADSNVIYWDTYFNETDLRKKEHYTIGCSNTDDNTEFIIEENSYYFTIDTRNKKVTLRMADNDEEVCTYLMEFDTKKGVFKLIDGRGNFMELDSVKDTMSIFTNSTVNVKTKTVNIDCDDYNLNCKNYNVNTQVSNFNHDTSYTMTGNNYTNNSTINNINSNVHAVNTNTHTINSQATLITHATYTISGGIYANKSATIIMSPATYSISCSSYNVSTGGGTFNHSGDFTMSGGSYTNKSSSSTVETGNHSLTCTSQNIKSQETIVETDTHSLTCTSQNIKSQDSVIESDTHSLTCTSQNIKSQETIVEADIHSLTCNTEDVTTQTSTIKHDVGYTITGPNYKNESTINKTECDEYSLTCNTEDVTTQTSTIKHGVEYTITGPNYKNESETFTLTNSSYVCTAGNILLDGNISCTSSVALSAGISVSGTSTFSPPIGLAYTVANLSY